MTSAAIKINGVIGSRDDLVLSTLVTLTNNDDTGVISWVWSFISKPPGSTATIASASSPTATFIPDVVGSYLIRLIVSDGLVNYSDRVIGAIVTSNLGIRIPAAYEETEFDTTNGWAGALYTTFTSIDSDVCLTTDSRLSNARTPTGSASGDLSGTYPSPTVAKIQGRSVDSSAPSDGYALVWDDALSRWKPGQVATSMQRTQLIWVDGNRTDVYVPDGTSVKPYLTITDALDSISDASGSKPYTVMISPGIYAEQVVMKDWVDVCGAGRFSTVITGPATGTSAVLFSNVTSGSAIQNCWINTSVSGQVAILFTTGTTWAQAFNVEADAVSHSIKVEDGGFGYVAFSELGSSDNHTVYVTGTYSYLDLRSCFVAGAHSYTYQDILVDVGATIGIQDVGVAQSWEINGDLSIEDRSSFIRNDSIVNGTSVTDALNSLDGYSGKSKISSADTTQNFLESKLTNGTNITITKINVGGNEQLRIAAPSIGSDGYSVKASSTDTTPAFLDTKLIAGTNIVLTKNNPSSNENYSIATPDYIKFDERASDPTSFTNDGYLYSKDIDGYTELYYLNSSGHLAQITYDGYLASIPREDEISSSLGTETYLSLTKVPQYGIRRRSRFDLDFYRNGVLLRFVSSLSGAGINAWTYNRTLNRVEFNASGSPGDWYIAIYRSKN